MEGVSPAASICCIIPSVAALAAPTGCSRLACSCGWAPITGAPSITLLGAVGAGTGGAGAAGCCACLTTLKVMLFPCRKFCSSPWPGAGAGTTGWGGTLGGPPGPGPTTTVGNAVLTGASGAAVRAAGGDSLMMRSTVSLRSADGVFKRDSAVMSAMETPSFSTVGRGPMFVEGLKAVEKTPRARRASFGYTCCAPKGLFAGS